MSKLHAAALVCAIGLSGALLLSSQVLAQTPTPDQRSACKQDYEKYCAGTEPGGGRIVACLNKHHDKLAAACQNAIDTRKKSQKPG
jgi:prephenate dehydrogenase